MDLKSLRNKIDGIDRKIIALLNARAELSVDIGEYKTKKGLSVYSPDREKEVYSKIAGMSRGPVKDKALKAIYREIMSSSLSLEKPFKVAYLGPELTFSHLAAIEKFGSSVEYDACKSITDVFTEVEKGRADYGVVPIENSTEGAVNHTLDKFVNSDLKICAESYVNIVHNFLGKTSDLKKIKYVYSHPQVLGQCRSWIEDNVPHAVLVESPSTTEAANTVSKRKDSACIASLLAKDKYGLKLIAGAVQDSSSNVTRFLIICRTASKRSGKDKTSIMFSIKDRAGALHDILVPFKKNRINLTKIESRPSKVRAWKYYFFVDLEGHQSDKKVSNALDELGAGCTFFKVLGSYPIAE